jgi:hypothetical protein
MYIVHTGSLIHSYFEGIIVRGEIYINTCNKSHDTNIEKYVQRIMYDKETSIPKTCPKIIKLRMETSLKSHGSDWLKWRLVSISANQMLEI